MFSTGSGGLTVSRLGQLMSPAGNDLLNFFSHHPASGGKLAVAW